MEVIRLDQELVLKTSVAASTRFVSSSLTASSNSTRAVRNGKCSVWGREGYNHNLTIAVEPIVNLLMFNWVVAYPALSRESLLKATGSGGVSMRYDNWLEFELERNEEAFFERELWELGFIADVALENLGNSEFVKNTLKTISKWCIKAQ